MTSSIVTDPAPDANIFGSGGREWSGEFIGYASRFVEISSKTTVPKRIRYTANGVKPTCFTIRNIQKTVTQAARVAARIATAIGPGSIAERMAS